MSSSPSDAARGPGPWPSRTLTLLTQAIVGLAFLWCLIRASQFTWYAMFTNFAPYDDEGYLLLSFREFISGRPLYDQVFSQYGPTPYAFKHFLSAFQGLPTQDITRHTTVMLWLSSCTALGAAALWLTRSGIAATAAFGAMVSALMALRSEPGHPQDLLVLLTSLSVAVAASPLRPYLRAVLLVALTALCAFAKINVGLFVGLATLGTLLPVGPGTARLVCALAMAAIPQLLMLRHLSEWAWPYALAASAAILTGVVSASDSGLRVWPVRKALPLVAAALLPVGLLVVYLLVRDSTVMGIVNGVLLRPIGLADIYINPFRLPVRPVAISVGIAALALSASRRESPVATWLSPFLPAIKIATGFYFLFWSGSLQETVSYAAVVVFVLLAGLESMPPRDRFGRVFLGLSAAFHTCTAYPVAGSQMWWSSFLLIMCAVICIWDGASRLRSAAAAIAPVQRTLATATVCLALCINFGTTTPVDAMDGLYRSKVALPFEGTTSIHIDAPQAGTYGWLVANLRGHCSNFVALPGFNSLHTWSGIRPVTGFNAGGAWMLQLNDAEQNEIVERLRQETRPCAVYAPAQTPLWTSRRVDDRPLVAYVLGMTTVAERAGYQIRVPATQADAWEFDYLLAGRRSFTPTAPSYPSALAALTPVASVRLWFRTREHGVLLGAQSGPPTLQPSAWCPVLYIGGDGRLRAELWNKTIEPMTSGSALNDGEWHHIVLVTRTDRQALYVDGVLAGEIGGPIVTDWADTLQIGNGFTANWPAGNGGWLPFSGEVRDTIVAPQAWDKDAVFRDFVRSADGEATH